MEYKLDKIKVVVIDNNVYVRMSLSIFLGTIDDIELVGVEPFRFSTVVRCIHYVPHVILIDFTYSTSLGIETVAALRLNVPKAAIIVMLDELDPELSTAALEAGADGFLSKTSTGAILVERIRSVHTEVSNRPTWKL